MKNNKPFDVKATNPRYRGVKLSDVAKVLTRPRNQKARETLERLQAGRSVTPEKVGEDPPAVKSAL